MCDCPPPPRPARSSILDGTPGLYVLQVAKGAPGLSLTQVPYFDVEVRNVYGLRFMAQTLFARRD